MSENIKFRILEKYETGGGAKLPIDYEDPKQVIHRPSINDVELVGNKTGEELGLADSSQITTINERIDAIEGDVSKIPTLETDVETAKTDIQTLGNTVDELSETVSSFDGDITQLKSDVSNHSDAIASLDETVAGHTTAIENNAIDISDLELAKADKTYVDGLVYAETTNRENADNQLQEQIDAIVSSSDVKDIVGTYAELLAYDTSLLGDEDIIKVLNDSTHDNAMSYYRWNATTQQWSYVGSEGPYYTKSESDNRYVPVTRTVNGKALSTNIELNATDVDAQDVLVSGENIKTVNNQSLLGAGNIDISDVFVATYGETTFADIEQAYNENKTVWLIKGNDTFQIASFIQNGNIQFVLHRLFATSSRLIGNTYFVDKVGENTYWSETTYLYPSTTNLKTINNESIIGNGNIDVGGGTVDTQMSDSSENAVQNKVIKSYVDTNGGKIDKIKVNGAEQTITNKEVDLEMPTVVTIAGRDETDSIVDILNNTANNQSGVIFSVVDDTVGFSLKNKSGIETQSKSLATTDYVDKNVGDLSSLTTDDKTSLVNALNEVYEKSGEPFRVKNWTGSWADGITIPVVTKEISNTQIPKLVFSIDAEEGASYQIVGMIAYEVFDAVNGGNRINVFQVCQFTGNGQKELSVRFMCAGTQDKVAKRINAWVLLKHR